jgi:two-component system sensor histidine kinase CpxA
VSFSLRVAFSRLEAMLFCVRGLQPRKKPSLWEWHPATINTIAVISRLEATPTIYRALANLVRNAVKYAASNGSIRVTAEKRADKVIIEVRDQGPGVPEHLLDQLFEPFFRPEASRDRDSGGVGLGLAIVKTCVEACKGTVSAANLQPHGFAVTTTLNA